MTRPHHPSPKPLAVFDCIIQTQNTAAVGVTRTRDSSNKAAVQRACSPQLTTHYYGLRVRTTVAELQYESTGIFNGITRCVPISGL